MKKTIYFFLFIIIIYLILSNSFEIIEGIRFSFSLCIYNLFPSLIPFMLISNILINYDFISEIGNIFTKFIKIFKISNNCSFILIMSMLSGTPSNSKYIKDLLDKELISISDAQKCLNFCHFTNPIFILGTIGLTFLNNKKMGLIILISHYMSAITIGLFNKKNKTVDKNDIKINIQGNFINILKEAITNTINTLFLMLGIITTTIIITSIINSTFKVPNNYKFLYGILEITQGLKYISISNFNIKARAVLSCFIISFGGFCIHAQVFSIIDNKKIRYLPYLISRLIHGILSSLICLIIINL